MHFLPRSGRFVSLSMTLFMVVLLASVMGCSDDDDGGTGPGLVTPSTDLTGSWAITEIVDGSACGPGDFDDSYVATVVQNGNALTVTIDGVAFNGTISGSTISWTGSFPEDGGTTTITSMNVNVNAAGDLLAGTASWSWTDGVDSCAGTTVIGGTKN